MKSLFSNKIIWISNISVSLKSVSKFSFVYEKYVQTPSNSAEEIYQ